MRLVTNVPTPPAGAGAWNSDLAFLRNYVIQGNYNGFLVWDVSNPARPAWRRPTSAPPRRTTSRCSATCSSSRARRRAAGPTAGSSAPQEAVSPVRMRGIRIFDISDIRNPRYVTDVQTCRGSHTHTVVTDPNDPANVYIYVSGSAAVRPAEELPGCSDLRPDEDPNSSLFQIEVIRVPLAAPQARPS
jgi:hypothetical protein